RHACARSRENETGLPARGESSDGEHDRGADLHGRTLASNRSSTKKTEQHEQDFADRDPDGDQALSRRRALELSGGDGLRDAAAARVGEIAMSQPTRGGKADWGQDKCGQRLTGEHGLEEPSRL